MSHSSLGSQQVDAYMFGTHEKKTSLQAGAKGPSGSVMEWEALFCHGEGAALRRKTNPEYAAVLSDQIRLK